MTPKGILLSLVSSLSWMMNNQILCASPPNVTAPADGLQLPLIRDGRPLQEIASLG